MDCPACFNNGQSNPLVFMYDEIESIPGDMETIEPPEKYPTTAECTYESDHFFMVEVDEDERIVSLILETEAPGEDSVYDFPLEDFEVELS